MPRVRTAPATCTVDGCERAHRARGYCSTHYNRVTSGRSLEPPVTDKRRAPVDVRFDRKWRLDAATGCHIWHAQLSPAGYGRFRISGSQAPTGAHIYAYVRAYGPMPQGLVLDHICHPTDGTCPGGEGCVHRRCCNPDHVRPVTQAENALRSATGRSAINARRTHCMHGHELPPYVPGGRRTCQVCLEERRYPSMRPNGAS